MLASKYRVGDLCCGCEALVLSAHDLQCHLLFLLQFSLISTMSLHISLSRPRNLSIHVVIGGWWMIQSSPKAVMMVRYHNRTTSLWKFTMSSWSSLGAILTPSWDHGVLSVLNTHYRISDIVRSSAEVKGSRLSCLAPSSLTGRPPGIGFRSSMRHVEIKRISGEMYIVTKPRQNWLWERVTAFISNGTAHTSTCLMYIDSRNFFCVIHTFEASLRRYLTVDVKSYSRGSTSNNIIYISDKYHVQTISFPPIV